MTQHIRMQSEHLSGMAIDSSQWHADMPGKGCGNGPASFPILHSFRGLIVASVNAGYRYLSCLPKATRLQAASGGRSGFAGSAATQQHCCTAQICTSAKFCMCLPHQHHDMDRTEVLQSQPPKQADHLSSSIRGAAMGRFRPSALYTCGLAKCCLRTSHLRS